jgi:phosphatidylglycerol:prolipoprotein diacylglycerol transferase
VVYGSVLGAGLGLIAFARIHRLHLLALSDLIAPSLALGQAIGRIGCFLNGCCYGGLATVAWAVAFPVYSPPYERQLHDGLMAYGSGLVLQGADDDAPLIADVVVGSPAAEAGLKRGDRLVKIDGLPVSTLGEAHFRLRHLDAPGERIEIETSGSRRPFRFVGAAPPLVSHPVHPTQLYGAIDGLLICLFLLAFYPFRRRDGEAIAWLVTIYPVTRFLMELVRTDEPGLLGTDGSVLQRLSSIGQLISVAILAGAALLWLWLRSRPRGSVLDAPPQQGPWVWTLSRP